jgi:hypothetical protein
MIQAQSGYAPGDPVEEANGGDILRYLFVVVGYLVVPALLLLAIAFAIVALVRNRKPGVILAASALGLLLLFVIAFVVLIAQLFEGISRVS